MTQLIDVLFEQELVPVGTVLTVRVITKNNLGMSLDQTREMLLEKTVMRGETRILTLSDHERRLSAAADAPRNEFEILAIDGMGLARFADLYNINADGSNRRVGKKRGRKCKVRG